MTKIVILALSVLVVSLNSAMAQRAGGEDAGSAREASRVEAAVRAVAKAWETADADAFRLHYSSHASVRILESGGQNAGVEDLIAHHVLPEREHFKSMSVAVGNVEVQFSSDGSTAWTISETEFRAETRDGKTIHTKGFGTMIFVKSGVRWRIVHSHSSSRRVRAPRK